MYVLYRRTTTSPGERKKKERERKKGGVSRCFLGMAMAMTMGGKDGGHIDKIVPHTFLVFVESCGESWGGLKALSTTMWGVEKREGREDLNEDRNQVGAGRALYDKRHLYSIIYKR